jgi:hypothetical protein
MPSIPLSHDDNEGDKVGGGGSCGGGNDLIIGNNDTHFCYW